MAYGNFILDKGYDAAAAIVKYRAVKISGTAEAVGPCTAEGDDVLGIAQFSVTATELANGKGASVRLMGISEMEAAAAITRGASVGIDADGKAITANTGSRLVGTALTGAGQAGDRVAVRLNLPGAVSA